MDQRTRKKLIKKCDDIARKLCKKRGSCEHCGSDTGQLHWAHVLSRRHKSIRWDSENWLLLCATSHRWNHENPIEFAHWFEQKWPGRFDRLNVKRQTITKVDLEVVFIMLKSDMK